MYELILRRSGLGLLIDKLCQFLTELSASDTIMVGYYYIVLCFYWFEAMDIPVFSWVKFLWYSGSELADYQQYFLDKTFQGQLAG